MQIGNKGLELIKEFEGYHEALPDGSCKAYLDTLAAKKYWSPGYNGLWTIGYGCTEGVTEGLIWTEKQAESALLKEIKKHSAAVTEMVTVKVNQNQFDALVSLSYNIGSGALSKSSLLKKLNAGDFDGAANSFKLYNKAGGKVVRGLVRRRAAEAELFGKPTVREVVKASKKLSWLQRLRLALVSLGGGTWLTWENLGAVKQFAQDNAGLMVLGVGAVLWVGMKLFEKRSIADYEAGRWTPSGLDEE